MHENESKYGKNHLTVVHVYLTRLANKRLECLFLFVLQLLKQTDDLPGIILELKIGNFLLTRLRIKLTHVFVILLHDRRLDLLILFHINHLYRFGDGQKERISYCA